MFCGFSIVNSYCDHVYRGVKQSDLSIASVLISSLQVSQLICQLITQPVNNIMAHTHNNHTDWYNRRM